MVTMLWRRCCHPCPPSALHLLPSSSPSAGCDRAITQHIRHITVPQNIDPEAVAQVLRRCRITSLSLRGCMSPHGAPVDVDVVLHDSRHITHIHTLNISYLPALSDAVPTLHWQVQ